MRVDRSAITMATATTRYSTVLIEKCKRHQQAEHEAKILLTAVARRLSMKSREQYENSENRDDKV